jgi:hypothetical protein
MESGATRLLTLPANWVAQTSVGAVAHFAVGANTILGAALVVDIFT